MIKKVLPLKKNYYIGPYRAIILPCLFPCGAPLGLSMGGYAGWALARNAATASGSPKGPSAGALPRPPSKGGTTYSPQGGAPQGNRQAI